MVISSAKVLVVATMMVVLLLMLAGSESSSIRSACKKNKMPTDVQVNGSAFTGKWYLRASEDLPAALVNLTSYGFRITPSENGTRLTIAGTMVFNEGERCNRTEYSCRFNDSVCTIDDGPNKGASFTVIAVDYDRVCAYFVRGKKYKSLRVMTRSPTADVDLSNLQCVTTFCGEEAADLDSEFYKYQFMYSSPPFALCVRQGVEPYSPASRSLWQGGTLVQLGHSLPPLPSPFPPPTLLSPLPALQFTSILHSTLTHHTTTTPDEKYTCC